MIYINIENLLKFEKPQYLAFLLVLKGISKIEDKSILKGLLPTEEDLQYLIDNKYIKYIKGSPNDSEISKLRLDTKGVSFLNNLDEPEVTDEDITIFNWLSEIYKKNEKQIGNAKKTKRLIAQFREKSGIEKNNLAYLCKEFINDEKEQTYSHKLEYVFFKSAHAFQKTFDLDSSRLYQYYKKREEYFNKNFVKLNKL